MPEYHYCILLKIKFFGKSTWIKMVENKKISGWGLSPSIDAEISRAYFLSDLTHSTIPSPFIPQGGCRSYGDACLAKKVLSTLPLNNFIEFDSDRGLLKCEAGITLKSILSFIVPRGYFLPVTPGTKHPTLGGCLAADVHGKNHHKDGSIANFTEEFELILADGTKARCSRDEEAELFWATIGGMGLTGTIYSVTLRLKIISSSFIKTRNIKLNSFEKLCDYFTNPQYQSSYSVAWIDTLSSQVGRSILMLGEHVDSAHPKNPTDMITHSDKKYDIPFFFPDFALNFLTMRTFNTLFYNKQIRRDRSKLIHYDPYFYPLDSIGSWNRIYGRKGFLQYQFLVPFDGGRGLMRDILTKISHRGILSFLSILKTLGRESGGLLSFPKPGYTLALDIPLKDKGIIDFLSTLTKKIIRSGGRMYLAKDAIISKNDFEVMYPRLNEFKRIKKTCDPHTRLRSLQSDRLGIT